MGEAEQRMPYVQPQELLERMGGVLHRWSMRGRAAAAVDISRQFERVVTSYYNLYTTATRLEQARLDHARAVGRLRDLDEYLEEDRANRREAFAIRAMRDEITKLQLQNEIDALKDRQSDAKRAAARRQEEPEAPRTPAEQLRDYAARRLALRNAVNELIEQQRQHVGVGPLPEEVEQEIQHLRDVSERLLEHTSE
jgi:hypothetical protein